MSDTGVPGLGDVFGLFGSPNPLASISKTLDQFKRGVTDFYATVETFNKTMESLNLVATRVNKLLDDIEEPIRVMVPQMTRSVKAADAVINQLSGPVEKVAPGLLNLANTLSSPVLTQMPVDLGAFLETLRDLAHRMQPLTQMADTATSLFGLRPLSVLRSGAGNPPAPRAHISPPPPAPAPIKTAPARKATAKKAPAKKRPAKKAPARKATTKKAPAKKVPAKKAAAKKSSS